MRKIVFIALLTALLTSCSKNNEAFIEHINGYWEIESVTFANGTIKEYTINQSIDYITINDSLKGFRKKLNPIFGDKYETSKHAEMLQLKIENDSLNIYYSTKYANWKETVIMANENRLQIVNKNNDLYLYKRFTPTNLDIEDK